MKITPDLVKHIANLSRLEFSDDEIKKFIPEMEGIMNHIDKLENINASGIGPTMYTVENTNIFREDQAKSSFSREEILRNSPKSHQDNQSNDDCYDQYFSVPNIVE